MTVAYIGLGSNLEDPLYQVLRACEELQLLPATIFNQRSRIYESESLLAGQPRYCNAVVKLETQLTAEELLDALQAIEIRQGRVRKERWGARIIDLDILLYGQNLIHSERLIVPHPELPNRDFWLYPLAELDNKIILPGTNIAIHNLIKQALPQSLLIIKE